MAKSPTKTEMRSKTRTREDMRYSWHYNWEELKQAWLESGLIKEKDQCQVCKIEVHLMGKDRKTQMAFDSAIKYPSTWLATHFPTKENKKRWSKSKSGNGILCTNCKTKIKQASYYKEKREKLEKALKNKGRK